MRASGILMPVFSLPGPFGIGTLGKEAFAFVDFLAEAKQTYWQILPIGPTGYGDSPYQSFSAFAGNPYFIDYRLLADVGLLTADEVPAARPVGPIDYGALYNERPVILKKAADRLLAAPSPAYEAFCEAQSFWLEDYALFMAVKAEQGQAGLADWPDELRCRQPEATAAEVACCIRRFHQAKPVVLWASQAYRGLPHSWPSAAKASGGHPATWVRCMAPSVWNSSGWVHRSLESGLT